MASVVRQRGTAHAAPTGMDESHEEALAGSSSADRNPFILPADEEVFRMRQEEKSRKAKERVARRGQKVWQKTTKSAVSGRSAKIGDLLKNAGAAIVGGEDIAPGKRALANAEMMHQAATMITNDRQQEKESMAEFISKKREMFLVQMSLDTKREEIRKLEEKARMKEEALRKSEQMLEEDAIRFDTFLKENDKKAHEAIKKAERETKLKTDKAQEIKKLNQQIQMVQSDMSKHREALEDCLRYKEFLDSLVPPEWFEEQNQIKRDRQEQRRQARIKQKKKSYEEAKKKVLAEFVEEERRRDEALAKQGRVKKKSEKKARQPDLPPPPKLDQEPLTSSEEDIPMFFTKQEQLLDIFQALEEQNLFFIQNSQETEHALDELKQNFGKVQKTMDTKTQALRSNIRELVDSIDVEEAKAEQLRKRIAASTGDTLDRQEELLKQLNKEVKHVYERCGFDASSSPTTLYMLSDLEARLEDLLSDIGQMPEEYVAKAEKASTSRKGGMHTEKEKKRREKKRAEQQALQELMQEERNRKAIERSLQAPRKKVGRPVMFRSRLQKRKVSKNKDMSHGEDLDEIKHLT
ncbi:unnamed protein product [Ectocarpus sp. 4 AP-2014]